MKKAKKQTHALSKYTEDMAVDTYILAKSGFSNRKISEALNINEHTFIRWVEIHPGIKHALERARNSNSNNGESETFREYVYRQLPPDLRTLWDKIELWSDHESGMEKVEALLSNHTVRVRQSLFMHAMVESNFNASQACRKVCISKRTLDNWTENDPDFPKLLDEIKWHRNNLFEGTLIKLVKRGNILATMFANRTQNRDRGYGEKVDVKHSGTVHHLHNHVVSVDRLQLPIAERRKLLDAVREIKGVEREETATDALPTKPAHAELIEEELAER